MKRLESFLAIVFLTVALGLSGCGDAGKSKFDARKVNSDPKAAIDSSPGIFYRSQAVYEWIETGERIEFDYVASCHNSQPMGSYASSIFPHSMFKPTSTGAAIQVFSMDLCLAGKWPNGAGDPHPFTIVFDDVNDLSQGWGYASYYAYDSPRSKIRFISGKITNTDRAAFNAWAEKAKAEYEQIGALPGPFGAGSYDKTPRDAVEKYNNGLSYLNILKCNGIRRYPLSKKVMGKIREFSPEPLEEFTIIQHANTFYTEWPYTNEMRALMWDLGRLHDADGKGHPLNHYMSHNYGAGTVSKDGNGHSFFEDDNPRQFAAEDYPFVGVKLGSPFWPANVENNPESQFTVLVYKPEYKGFIWCESDKKSSTYYPRGYHPIESKKIKQAGGDYGYFVNDHRLSHFKPEYSKMLWILDRDGGVFFNQRLSPTRAEYMKRTYTVKTEGLQ